MVDFTYKNTAITGAATLDEAKELAVTAYLRQFGEPTHQEIDDLLAEIEAEEAEKFDVSSLSDDINTQIIWVDDTIPEIDNGLTNVTAFTNATQRAIVTGLLQNQRRTLLILKAILKAFRFIIRRIF
jgi:hypothetical protein